MSNRLANEDSPYLQQHKNNPIDWYPWCEEAFAKAQKEQKGIFISIGYSSCHWCHVMEAEVFEHKKIASFVNDHFVCIKVDREERPDIDKYYQEVYQLLNRKSGGWPTSIFCTPQNKPIFAGTYIPPYDQNGMTGFSELTAVIAKKIAQNDSDLYKNADEIATFLKQEHHPKEATVLKQEIYKTFMLQVKNNFDKRYGGFSTAPKFPYVATLSSLLDIYRLYGDEEVKNIVTLTLDNMIAGGMYDLIDGGFCRYSTDQKWLVPHFEKMTYDNALLAEVYIKAYVACKDERYLDIAKEIIGFMQKFMQEDDLFYSASDADSDEAEGSYFTYDYDEVESVLQQSYDKKVAKEILKALHVSKLGNFEGRNIIRFEAKERPYWYDDVMQILRGIRLQREYPFVDKKVQTSWNAMMIKTLFALSCIDESYMDRAVAHLEMLLKTMYIDNVLYHSTLIHKPPKIKAFLEDYAYLGTALIAAYEATFDEMYLILAQRIANSALAEFYSKGKWFFSKDEFSVMAEASDNTYPSPVGKMTDLLLSLSSLLEDKYRTFAFKTLEYNSYELGRKPIYFPTMLGAMLRYLRGDAIIRSNTGNLKKHALAISLIEYPFVIKHASGDGGFLLCRQDSCFANVEDMNEVKKNIQKVMQEEYLL